MDLLQKKKPVREVKDKKYDTGEIILDCTHTEHQPIEIQQKIYENFKLYYAFKVHFKAIKPLTRAQIVDIITNHYDLKNLTEEELEIFKDPAKAKEIMLHPLCYMVEEQPRVEDKIEPLITT